ncbi:hypothetical protein AAMO2058_001119800 [Amorphochlora amoebiformis]
MSQWLEENVNFSAVAMKIPGSWGGRDMDGLGEGRGDKQKRYLSMGMAARLVNSVHTGFNHLRLLHMSHEVDLQVCLIHLKFSPFQISGFVSLTFSFSTRAHPICVYQPISRVCGFPKKMCLRFYSLSIMTIHCQAR